MSFRENLKNLVSLYQFTTLLIVFQMFMERELTLEAWHAKQLRNQEKRMKGGVYFYGY